MGNSNILKKPDDQSEFEKFEQAAKKLFSLTPQELEEIKKEEKEQGIEPDPSDFEPESEETENS